MGLDIYLSWKDQTEEEEKARYTGYEQAGEAGYLRSSYNDGGFNSWARRNLNVDGFYYIFDYEHDGGKDVVVGKDEEGNDELGYFPNWKLARERTNELLEKALALPPLTQVRIPSYMFEWPDGFPQNALEVYMEERKRYDESRAAQPDNKILADFSAYSNKRGEFFMGEPLVVRAAIPVEPVLGTIADLVLICEDEHAHDYYIEVLSKDVPAFIELGERKNGYMYFSG